MHLASKVRWSVLVVSLAVLWLAACSAPTEPSTELRLESLSFQAPEVVADGLANPRGVAVTPDGAVLVAEAGSGGAGPCFDGPEGEACFGTSGALTRVDRQGVERIVDGLPSLASPSGEGALGPHDVSLLGNGTTYLTTGLGADPSVRDALGLSDAGLGLLWRVNQARGAVTSVADVAGWEAAENPNGDEVDSNPYGVLAVPSGQIVADAGGNSLVRVSAAGAVETLAVFPATTAPAPPFLGLPPGTMIPMQAVPTSVAEGPDGAYYVGLLTGFPFPVGAASVMRVVPGEAPSVFATGFTNIIDVAFGPDGHLYVLEIATNGLLSGDPAGALKRVVEGGVEEVPGTAGTLLMPGGMAFDASGTLYVSNLSVTPDGALLRFEP